MLYVHACTCVYASACAGQHSHCDCVMRRRPHSRGPSRLGYGGGELSHLYFFNGKLKFMTGKGGMD